MVIIILFSLPFFLLLFVTASTTNSTSPISLIGMSVYIVHHWRKMLLGINHAAASEVDDEDLNQYNQDAIEVFTEASLLDNEENEKYGEGTETIEILTKCELEKKFSARRREAPEDFDNLTNYALFLIFVRGDVDADRAEKILKEAEGIVGKAAKGWTLDVLRSRTLLLDLEE